MFPLTLASSTIVHPLSGPSIGNSTQIYRENWRRRSEPIWLLCSKSVKSASANTSGLARILFSSLLSLRIGVFITPILSPMIDSLVRVTRRDEWNHFQFDVSVRRSNAPSRAASSEAWPPACVVCRHNYCLDQLCNHLTPWLVRVPIKAPPRQAPF